MAPEFYAEWTEASAAKGPGDTVCGFVEDGDPIYWVMPADATDAEVAEVAFRAKHGRPMNTQEQLLNEMTRDFAGA